MQLLLSKRKNDFLIVTKVAAQGEIVSKTDFRIVIIDYRPRKRFSVI